jgi:DNA-directed RNA polymerase subunit beta
LTANEEDEFLVAQANEPLSEKGEFESERVVVRFKEEILEIDKDKVDFMDVAPKQIVSVATGMIPFLENDDANRALMGANMQRQAVPLIKTDSPIIGTGMEYIAAKDSGVVVLTKHDGVIDKVRADEIVVKRDDNGDKVTYKLLKYMRSNQGTCVNQRPIVEKGEDVKAGDVIADGPSTSYMANLHLGKNTLIVGFMTWEGYNYEDAILDK